ncbi:MAG: hypothetical protein WCK49_08655, partial [Myxococcaceae bacterium]
MAGPTLGSVFSFLAFASSAFGLAEYAVGYNQLEGDTSSNQKSALALNIASVAANLVATTFHPVWTYYRRVIQGSPA